MDTAAVLKVMVIADTAKANAGLAATDARLRSIGTTGSSVAARGVGQVDRSLKNTGKSISSFGQSMTRGLTVPIAAVGVAAGAFAIDFDKSMRNVNSLAGLPEPQFQSLRQSVLSLAGPTAQAPKTLAEGLYDLVSSGFTADQSLQILQSSAKGASAGLTDTVTSTRAVAAVLNAYHRPASDAAAVTDDLFQTVKLGVIRFDELANTIGDVLPFANQMGVDLKGVGAAVTTMTKAGINAPETMTRVKNTMVAMLKPSKDLEAAYETLGVSGGQELIQKMGGGTVGFQHSLEAIVNTTAGAGDLQQAYQDLGVSGIDQLKKKTGSMGAANSALAQTLTANGAAIAKLFPNIRALGGVLALTGDNAKGAEKDLAGMKDTTGAVDEVFKEQKKSVALQLQQMWSEIQVALIKVGDAILPTIIPVIKAVGKAAIWMANAFSGLPGPIKTTIVVIAGLLAVLGPIAVVAGAAVSAIGALAPILGLLAGAGGAAVAGEQLALFGAEAAAAGAGAGLMEGGLLGLAAAAAPVALTVAAIVGPALILNHLFASEANHDFADGMKMVGEATRETATDVRALTSSQAQLRASNKELNRLNKEGNANSKEGSAALEKWAQAYNTNNAAVQKNQANAEKYREGIGKMRDGLKDLTDKTEMYQDLAKKNPFNKLYTDAAEKGLEAITQQQNQLNNAVIAYRRARQGKDPVSSQAAEALSALRQVAGKKATAKIGVTGTDASIQAIGSLTSKLKGIAPSKVVKILASGGSAEQILRKLKGLLDSLHDKNVKAKADTPGLDKVVSLKNEINGLQSRTLFVDYTIRTHGSPPAGATPSRSAVGSRSFDGGPAIVNEAGPEMAELNGKRWMLGNGRTGAQLIPWVAEGTRIYTASETRALQSAGVPAFAKGKKNKPTKAEKRAAKQEKRQAARDSVSGTLEAQLAAAELTGTSDAPITDDDIAALTALLTHYKNIAGWSTSAQKKNIAAAQKLKPIKRKARLDILNDALGQIKTYQGQLDEINGVGSDGSASDPSVDQLKSDLADYYKDLAIDNAQLARVSEAQSAAMLGVSSIPTFADGGVMGSNTTSTRVDTPRSEGSGSPLNIDQLIVHGDGRVSMRHGGRDFDGQVKKVTRKQASGVKTPGGSGR